jgi:hypothetical protein
MKYMFLVCLAMVGCALKPSPEPPCGDSVSLVPRSSDKTVTAGCRHDQKIEILPREFYIAVACQCVK